MEWRLALSLFFLLILLVSVLHLAYSVVPPVHGVSYVETGGLPGLDKKIVFEEPAPGPVSPEYGKMHYATMTNQRIIESDRWKRVAPPPKFALDASGNVFYPF